MYRSSSFLVPSLKLLLSLLLATTLILQQISFSAAFSVASPKLTMTTAKRQNISNNSARNNFYNIHTTKASPSFSSSTKLTASISADDTTEPTKLYDDNKAEFTEGCTVKLTSEKRAYHVAVKSFGRFADDDDKTFIPLDLKNNKDTVQRVDRCLVLPPGLEGTVVRVYDVSDFDANLPIKAKFVAGEGGEYVLPVTFLMHFDTFELEVVQ